MDGGEHEGQPATPRYEGDTGLFHMSTAYTLPKGKLSFGVFRDNFDRDPKDMDISIHGFSFAYGATSRLEWFGTVGSNRINADALFQPGIVNDYPFVRTSWQTGAGDVRTGLKYKLLDQYDGVGLALRGFLKIPTADEEKGLGTGRISAGLDMIISRRAGRNLVFHGSFGYQVNRDPDRGKVGDALKWGIGVNLPANGALQIQAEMTGTSYRGADFHQTNPLDLVIGPVIHIKPGIFIRPAVSWNLKFDDRGLNSSSKTYTGRHISIGYHPGALRVEVHPPLPPPPPPPASNRAPTVACEAERSRVVPGENVRLRAVASDPDRDDLTYVWSASAGRVSGAGTEATFDSAGVAPGLVDIIVRVSDGRGGTAEARCPIGVETRPRPPSPTLPTPCAPYSCCGFSENSDSLFAQLRACILGGFDSVELWVSEGGTVTVVGHTSVGERNAAELGCRRARAALEYLVERGLPRGRLVAKAELLPSGTPYDMNFHRCVEMLCKEDAKHRDPTLYVSCPP